jgi:multidrug efflux pump subunit AcrB
MIPALLLVVGGCFRPRSEPTAGPIVTIEASYPRASAQEIAETLAEPIEQQVLGVEKMVHMRSRSTSDGTYRLDVVFGADMAPDLAQTLTQNRVALVMPILPEVVKREGLTIQQKSPQVLAIVTVSSPDGSRDVDDLANYVDAHLKDELARLRGVAGVSVFGRTEYVWRLWIDNLKLEAFGLTAADVAKAIEQEPVVAGEDRQRPLDKARQESVPANLLGRLLNVERLQDLKVGPNRDGQAIALRDVARVELGAKGQGYAYFAGKPVVALAVRPTLGARPRELSAAIRDLLARLGPGLPPGVHLDVAMDFTPNLETPDLATAPKYMLIDMFEPPNVLPERTLEDLKHCEIILREVTGVQAVLALTQHLFDFPRERPCVLVRLAPTGGKQADRGELAKTLRSRLTAGVRDVVFQVRDLSGPGPFPALDFPIDLAVRGPKDGRYEDLLRKAERVLRQLNECPLLTGAMISRVSMPREEVFVGINEDAVKAKDVPADNVLAALQVLVTDGADLLVISPASTLDGRLHTIRDRGPWRYTGTLADRLRARGFPDVLKKAKVRTTAGRMVPLADLVDVRAQSSPDTIERLDGQPMVEITASLAPGADPAKARRESERLVDELTLSSDYGLTWLRRPTASQ